MKRRSFIGRAFAALGALVAGKAVVSSSVEKTTPMPTPPRYLNDKGFLTYDSEAFKWTFHDGEGGIILRDENGVVYGQPCNRRFVEPAREFEKRTRVYATYGCHGDNCRWEIVEPE